MQFKMLAQNVRSVLLSAQEVGPLQKLRRESIIFLQHQEGAGLFLIESGLAKLIRTGQNGNKLILSVVGPDQLVGEEVLVNGLGAYTADVICLTDVTGYHIPSDSLKRLLGVPDLADAILSYAIQRDQERINRLEMLALYDVEQRVLYGLAELAKMVKPSADGLAYPIPVTQLEVATFVGATRETISSTLGNLQDRSLVTLGRRLVTTVHPKLLIDAANDRLVQSRAAS